MAQSLPACVDGICAMRRCAVATLTPHTHYSTLQSLPVCGPCVVAFVQRDGGGGQGDGQAERRVDEALLVCTGIPTLIWQVGQLPGQDPNPNMANGPIPRQLRPMTALWSEVGVNMWV